jgi:hypothetical protein
VSSRPVKRRTVTRPTTSRRPPSPAKAVATRTSSPRVVKPKPAISTPSPVAVPSTPATGATALAIADPPKLTIGDRAAVLREKARAQHERFIKSIESVQAPSSNTKPRPRWFKIATWLIMLMPAYAIVIYVIGFFILGLPAQNIGLAKSFAITPTATVGNVLVPNTEGIFLQASAGSQQGLALINDFPSRSIQPPQSAQVTLKPGQLRYILIREAQVDIPGDYRVFRIKDGSPDVPVTVSAQRVHVPGIALVSIGMPNGQAWPAGEYMIIIPEAGLDDEDSFSFFTVS